MGVCSSRSKWYIDEKTGKQYKILSISGKSMFVQDMETKARFKIIAHKDSQQSETAKQYKQLCKKSSRKKVDISNLSSQQINKIYLENMNKILRKWYNDIDPDKLPITKIKENIYLGNQNDSENINLLTSMQITHVLNCAGLDIQNKYPLEIKQHKIDADDEVWCNIITQYLQECIEFINECLQNNGKILIHCVQGVNRSATILIGYLMYSQNMNILEAVELVIKRRGKILDNKSFRQQLVDYAQSINRINNTTNSI
eukprot:124938_1